MAYVDIGKRRERYEYHGEQEQEARAGTGPWQAGYHAIQVVFREALDSINYVSAYFNGAVQHAINYLPAPK